MMASREEDPKAALIQLRSKFQSLAAEFQQYVASTRSPFMELPAELRNRIYGLVFKKRIYEITGNVFPEHPLLAVSKQIRKEAGPIFFRRRHFHPRSANYDSTPLFTFEFKKRAVLKEFNIDLTGSESLMYQTPNWENLLIRLRRVHAYYQTLEFKNVDAPDTTESTTINAMYHVVFDMRGTAWSEIESGFTLEALHEILCSADARWAGEDDRWQWENSEDE